jgi:hypothetical protein
MLLRLLVVQRHVWAYLHLVLKKETLTADICWTIKAITSHYCGNCITRPSLNQGF